MKCLRISYAILRINFYQAIVFIKKKIYFCNQIPTMIQRIQTIYLLLAFVTTGILPFFTPLWFMKNDTAYYFMQNQIYVVVLGLSTTLTLFSIVSYKKRQNQFVLGRLNIILNLILLGLFVYHSLTLSGEAAVSEKGIGMFLPILAIVLLALANKAIKKDEDLVKSVDRLR